jgi:hypothetical protein
MSPSLYTPRYRRRVEAPSQSGLPPPNPEKRRYGGCAREGGHVASDAPDRWERAEKPCKAYGRYRTAGYHGPRGIETRLRRHHPDPRRRGEGYTRG